MALIKCLECSNEVSDSALKCTHCGKQLKKPKRSFIGKIFKWIFILFNILMLIWILTGLGASADHINNATSEAERAGASLGTGLAVYFLLSIWVIGDIILGLFVLFTRPKS